MTEIRTEIPETEKRKAGISGAEAAPSERQTQEKPQLRRPVEPPPDKAERAEDPLRDFLDSLPPQGFFYDPRERPRPKVVSTREEVAARLEAWGRPPLTEEEWQRMLRRESYLEMTAQGKLEESQPMYEEDLAERKARQAKREAMTPEEREQDYQKEHEERRRIDDIKDLATLTPEQWEKRLEIMKHSKELMKKSAALMVGMLKTGGVIPPNLDHVWLNLPTGWVEYREEPGKDPPYTVTPGTPTKEQWDKWTEEMKTWRIAQNAQKGKAPPEGNARIDPLTGDTLQPNEFPLDPTTSYHLNGKARPRRFLPPDSSSLKTEKPLETGGEEQEDPDTQRLIQRLRKAGFVEVAPTPADQQRYEFSQWLNNLPPAERTQYLLDSLQQMRGENLPFPYNDKNLGLKVISALFELILALLSPYLEEKKKGDEPSHQSA
jgi:hypothetical protein